MFAVRYRATLFLAVCSLAGLSRVAVAEPRRLAVLAGIFILGDDAVARKNEFLGSAVARRLRSLDIMVGTPTESNDPCREAACLPQLVTEKAGADFAITGTVYRTADLCTATLLVYERSTARERSADIRCQPGSSEESLASEFADQVGRLSETIIPGAPAFANSPAPVGLVPMVQLPPAPHGRPLWLWDWKRKSVAYGLGASLAILIGASISTSIFASTIQSSDNPLEIPAKVLWGAAAATGAAFIVTVSLPTERK